MVLNPSKLLTEVIRNDAVCPSAACCSVCIRQEREGAPACTLHRANYMEVVKERQSIVIHGSCARGKMLEEIHTLGLLLSLCNFFIFLKLQGNVCLPCFFFFYTVTCPSVRKWVSVWLFCFVLFNLGGGGGMDQI